MSESITPRPDVAAPPTAQATSPATLFETDFAETLAVVCAFEADAERSQLETHKTIAAVIRQALVKHRLHTIALLKQALEEIPIGCMSDQSLDDFAHGWTPRQVRALVESHQRMNERLATTVALARCVEKGYAE